MTNLQIFLGQLVVDILDPDLGAPRVAVVTVAHVNTWLRCVVSNAELTVCDQAIRGGVSSLAGDRKLLLVGQRSFRTVFESNPEAHVQFESSNLSWTQSLSGVSAAVFLKVV